MSEIPATDAEWEGKLSQMKESLQDHSLSQPAMPLGVHRIIDHTLLTTPVEVSQIDKLCEEAREYGFAAVCVRVENVARAVEQLKGSKIGIACVIAFPDGTNKTEDKVREAKEAIEQGATELDMVTRWPLLKKGHYVDVYQDIVAVRKVATPPIILKTIVEASKLNEDELIDATVVSCMAGADFVKTSSGWNGGATTQSVTRMRLAADLCGRNSKIKASGGLRTAGDVVRMIKAGAHRIGTSTAVQVMEEMNEGEILEQGASHAVS